MITAFYAAYLLAEDKKHWRKLQIEKDKYQWSESNLFENYLIDHLTKADFEIDASRLGFSLVDVVLDIVWL